MVGPIQTWERKDGNRLVHADRSKTCRLQKAQICLGDVSYLWHTLSMSPFQPVNMLFFLANFTTKLYICDIWVLGDTKISTQETKTHTRVCSVFFRLM